MVTMTPAYVILFFVYLFYFCVAYSDCSAKCFVRAPPTNVVGAMNIDFACLYFCPFVSGHSNSVIFNWISSKIHIWIVSMSLSFRFEYRFFLIR